MAFGVGKPGWKTIQCIAEFLQIYIRKKQNQIISQYGKEVPQTFKTSEKISKFKTNAIKIKNC